MWVARRSSTTTCARCWLLFLPRPRTFQRTSYPGRARSASSSLGAFEPGRSRSGAGQTRRGYVVVACLPYSRAGAGDAGVLEGGARISCTGSAAASTGWADCRRRSSGTARARCTPAAAARPTPSPPSCGELRRRLGASSRPHDPQAKGVVERLAGLPGDKLRARAARSPGRSTTRSSSTAGSPSGPTCASTARCAAGPLDRLAEELALMRPLPERMPDVDRRLVTRVRSRPVRPGRHQRLLARPAPGRAPRRAAGSRNERSSQPASTPGELACRHVRSFARHRTITALEHARSAA